MRKFSRILAVVLTVALLCGAVAVLASADATDNITVTGAGVTQYNATDFTGVSGGVQTWLQPSSAADQVSKITTDASNDNAYFTWTGDASNEKMEKGASSWIGVFMGRLGTTRKPLEGESLAENAFVVTDFDFAADKYVYENGTATKTIYKSTDKDGTIIYQEKTATTYYFEETDGAKRPAYPIGNLQYLMRVGDGTNVSFIGNANVMVIWADANDPTKVYLSDYNKTVNYELPSETGVWTHVTTVFEVADNVASSKLHIYINGAFAFTVNNPLNAKYTGSLTESDMGFDSIRFNLTAYQFEDVSLAFDNVATHYYAKDYAGELANFNFGSAISAVDDVVYNGSYLSPNGAYGTVDGVAYDTQDALLSAIKSGSAVVLNQDVSVPYTPTFSFTVKTNGHRFAIDSSSGYALKETSTPGVYEPINAAANAEYVITNKATGEVILYGADIKNIISDVNAVSASSFKVVLQKDLYITDPSNYRFTFNSKDVEFDLNGYDIYHNIFGVNAQLFLLTGTNTSFYLYSSKPDAKIVSLCYDSKYTTTNSAGVVNPHSNSVNPTTTIGNGTNNLTIHCSIFYQGTTKGAHSLTLNGGTYLAPRTNGWSIIQSKSNATDIANGVLTLTIKNAYIASHEGTLLAGGDAPTAASFSKAGTIATVTNSTIIVPEIVSSGKFYNSTITFEDCYVIGKMEPSSGSVILGDGTKYAGATNDNVACADGYLSMTISESYSYNYNVFIPAYDTEKGSLIASSITTPVNKGKTVTLTGSVEKIRELITVTWADEKGKTIFTDQFYEGETAVFRGKVEGERVSPWFIKGIAGWENEDGNNNLKVSKSNNFFTAIPGNMVDIEAFYNFKTTTAFVGYVYIPVPSKDSGIEVVQVYDAATAAACLGTANRQQANVTINGIEYYRVMHSPGANNTANQKYDVEYTYQGNTYKYRITTSTIAEYFGKILADNTQCEEAKVLAATAANYCHNVLKFVNAKASTGYESILEDYSSYIKTVTDAQIAKDNVSSKGENFDDYIGGVTFAIGNGYRPIFAFAPAEGSEVARIAWNYSSYDAGGKIYKKTSWNGAKGSVNWGGLIGGSVDVSVYDIRSAITITAVYDADNAKIADVTGTYSLAAYYASLKAIENPSAAEQQAIEVVKALYAYSIASYEYKSRPQTAK